MNVELIDSMGDDLMVVNAARVSFNKESNYLIEGDINTDDWKFILPEGDKKLLKYLADHKHWTPFSHPQITLRIKAPIFVRTQLFKHKVGFTENEVSRRYVDYEPEFFMPDEWRGRPAGSAKQGSSDIVLEGYHDPVQVLFNYCLTQYEAMIKGGVAPEQARMVLPQSMYTEWYWTGSLAAYARMCKLRLASDAQSETREIAEKISKIIGPMFPVSWPILIGEYIGQ